MTTLAQYIAVQRAQRMATRGTLTGDMLAESTGQIVNAAIIACTSQTVSNRLVAGVTTGAQYGASLAALGAAAGPYGAAAGAVVGFGAGFAQGFTPSNRSTFADRFGTMVAALTPGIRQRLVPWVKTWAATCRTADGSGALGPWQSIDQSNVNIFGSAQIMCLWAMQHLLTSSGGFWEATNVPSSTPFASLPRSWQYAVGLYTSNQPAAQNLQAQIGGMAQGVYGQLGAWIERNGFVSSTGITGVFGGVEQSAKYTTTQIRSVLESRQGGLQTLPDMTTLPDDPGSLALRADPRNLEL